MVVQMQVEKVVVVVKKSVESIQQNYSINQKMHWNFVMWIKRIY